MRISIYQPRYFPQLHYFNRALDSDVFVILDNAQYTKALVHLVNGKKERHKSFQSDTVIKFPEGSHFLTVSIKHNGLLPINKTQLDYTSDWARRHSATVNTAYGKSEFFNSVFPQIDKILKDDHKSLGELNIRTFLWGIAYILGINTDPKSLTVENINKDLINSPFRLKRILLGSELGVERPEGAQKGTEWTVAICKKLGADEYMHGETAQNGYMNEKYYKENNITLVAQKWNCREYTQQFKEKSGFISNLSIVDLLLNVNRSEAIDILKNS